jgi:DNA-binding beta-propeller fold protein YncE
MVGEKNNNNSSRYSFWRIYFIFSLLVIIILFNISVTEQGNNIENFSPSKNDFGRYAEGSSLDYIFITSWNNSFNFPSDIAIDPLGAFVLVVDSGNNRIQKFDSNGYDDTAKPIGQWGTFGTNSGEFVNPTYIELDSSGKFVYVADTNNDRIQKFDSNGNFIAKWGSKCNIRSPSTLCVDPDGPGPLSLGDGQFNGVGGIAIDNSSYIYVTDSRNHRIQKFDSNGNFIAKWGGFGRGDNQFRIPSGVAVDALGKFVYVADTNNNRIQKFDSNGNFIAKWNTIGSNIDRFYHPLNVAIDPSGQYVYVADTDNHKVEKFYTNGSLATQWGSECSLSENKTGCVDPDGPGPLSLGDGQFNGVDGISFDPSGTFVYVIDSGNSRVQVFSLPPRIEITRGFIDNPNDPFRGLRWGIDKFVVAGNSSYSASSYSVSIDWGDGTTTTGIPITALSGLWGYKNYDVKHIYNSSAILNNPQKITAKLVNKDGVEKAASDPPELVDIVPHRIGLFVYPADDYSVPWNGTTIFPWMFYDYEIDSDPFVLGIKGKMAHFEGTGAINLIDKATDDKGRLIVRGKAPETVGQWWVNMRLNGAPEYESSFDSVIYNTTKHEVLIQFSILPNPVSPGQNYLIDGVLFDRFTGERLNSKQVQILESFRHVSNSTTNIHGKFQAILKAPNNPGSVPLMVYSRSDDLYYSKNSTVQWLEVQ